MMLKSIFVCFLVLNMVMVGKVFAVKTVSSDNNFVTVSEDETATIHKKKLELLNLKGLPDCSNEGCSGPSNPFLCVYNSTEKVYDLKIGTSENCEVVFKKNQEEYKLKAVKKKSLPIYNLVSKDGLIKHLNDNVFRYLFWSHNFLSHERYYPNVAKFFREQQDITMKRRDEIVFYVMRKYTTTHAVEITPVEYVQEFIDSWQESSSYFPENVFVTELSIAGIYQHALTLENAIVREITKTINNADKIKDAELSEFLAADILPPILENIKLLKSHHFQVKGLPKVGLFMFDKTNYS